MKKQKNDNVWLAYYIYYTSSPDELLVKKIFPLVKDIFKKKWAEQYFFIRYGDSRGRHIRLRFKGEQATLENKINPLLKKTFPKSRFVTYRPELGRYGGKIGIILSERLFEVSSNAVLSFLAEKKEYTYKQSLGFSLQLNLSMAHALEMKRAQAIAFFDHIAAYKYRPEFDVQLAKNKDTLSPFLSNLWTSLDKQTIFDKIWFNTWLKEVTNIAEELRTYYRKNKLKPLDPKKTHQQNPLWYIYESYIHMNNNRLGIYNSDEPYIAYIIKQALSYEK